jgi:hypothetical protein
MALTQQLINVTLTAIGLIQMITLNYKNSLSSFLKSTQKIMTPLNHEGHIEEYLHGDNTRPHPPYLYGITR